MDVAVAGPNFGASAVPSLKQYLREVSKAVPSPKGGSVYEQWKADARRSARKSARARFGQWRRAPRQPNAMSSKDVNVGDLGSGSDFTPFLQHLGVPSTDIGSSGPYGVYHSVFDNFAWFTKFGDPTFVYEQQMARVYGLQSIRMASEDVLPFNYEDYGKEIGEYVKSGARASRRTHSARSRRRSLTRKRRPRGWKRPERRCCKRRLR